MNQMRRELGHVFDVRGATSLLTRDGAHSTPVPIL